MSADHAARHDATSFVYNGLDPADFEFREQKGDYDLFLGRLHNSKGYQWAIAGARTARRSLVVAGGWRPSLSRQLRFAGLVDGAEKRELLAGARLLWMPALWDEPFGLTLIEALWSGTPVLGTRRGALPEVLSPAVAEFGDNPDELVARLPAMATKEPAACRARAERYFSHRRMAEEYVRLYREYLATGILPAADSAPKTSRWLDWSALAADHASDACRCAGAGHVAGLRWRADPGTCPPGSHASPAP